MRLHAFVFVSMVVVVAVDFDDVVVVLVARFGTMEVTGASSVHDKEESSAVTLFCRCSLVAFFKRFRDRFPCMPSWLWNADPGPTLGGDGSWSRGMMAYIWILFVWVRQWRMERLWDVSLLRVLQSSWYFVWGNWTRCNSVRLFNNIYTGNNTVIVVLQISEQ